MKYRRRRRAAGRRGKDSASGAGALLLAVLLFAGVVYFVSASSAGDWLTENVMAPLFAAKPTAPAATDSGDTVESVDGSVAVDALEYYAVQLGVFASKENAEQLAAAMKEQGAGGYMLTEDGRYRVLACAFEARTDADSVKEKLISGGYDCTLYEIAVSADVFAVSAPQEQLTKMAELLPLMRGSITALGDISLKFDVESQSVEEGVAAVRALYEDVSAAGNIASLRAVAQAQAVGGCYDVFVTALKVLAEQNFEDAVDFSSNIKYTQLQLIHQYMALAGELASGA
ncbi:MAG: SPOR domain-containing protein [Clostridia bacterium]|nr:SPOR domain-containing protein [Clostridia bacterium]